jgi:hypothetical protein
MKLSEGPKMAEHGRMHPAAKPTPLEEELGWCAASTSFSAWRIIRALRQMTISDHQWSSVVISRHQ